jgi:hypothetical protein
VPQVCTVGNDPINQAAWVVCAADANTAWISHALPDGGTFQMDLICQSLGYSQVLMYGGTCGDICGYCQGNVSSYMAPGTQTFDGGNGCTSPEACSTVTWLCGR